MEREEERHFWVISSFRLIPQSPISSVWVAYSIIHYERSASTLHLKQQHPTSLTTNSQSMMFSHYQRTRRPPLWGAMLLPHPVFVQLFDTQQGESASLEREASSSLLVSACTPQHVSCFPLKHYGIQLTRKRDLTRTQTGSQENIVQTGDTLC